MERLCEMEKQKPKKEGRFFQKGHPGYYAGKTFDGDDYKLVFEAWACGKITWDNAVEILGVSAPTAKKWQRKTFEVDGDYRQLPFLTWKN